MAGFQTLPAPRINPYAGEDARAVMDIIRILGQGEAARRSKMMTQNVLKAIASGAGTEGIAQASMMEPQFSSGLPGIIQKIASPFAVNAPGIDDIITGKAIDMIYRRPNVGTIPFAVTQMNKDQFQNYLDNYGRGVTVQTGERLLSEEDRRAIAEVEKNRKLGRTGPGLSITERKTINADLDIAIKKSMPKVLKKGWMNLPEDKVYENWLNFNSMYSFDNDDQKREVLNTFKNKIENRAGKKRHETNINWDDPKWKQAVGLSEETQTTGKSRPNKRKLKMPGKPEDQSDFEEKVRSISDPGDQQTYYNKWKSLWPDEYE